MHPLLARQLKKLGFCAMDVPKIAELLEAVSRTYQTADEDRVRLERSLDFSSQEAHEKYEQIQYQANHDRLTGLLNRNSFLDNVGYSLTQAAEKGLGCAVLNFDIDNFKLINDTLGHDFGDELLMHVADRLRENLDHSNVIARIGGDEFCLLSPNVDSIAAAESIANDVLKIIQSQVVLNDAELILTASIGIAVGWDGLQSASNLLRKANIAMFHCKTYTKSRYAFYDQTMEDGFADRFEIAMSLRKALDRGELFVQYQPIVDLETGWITGAEALVRWLHPEQGLISPVRFIPVAEDTGLVLPIGEFVLRTACDAMKHWNDAQSDCERVVSVNLSGRQLQQADILDCIDFILNQTGLDPRHLKLEITESMLMSDIDEVAFKLGELKNRGITLALDDFGTGYSSLATLNSFPIDTLKVDRSFLSQIETSENARAVVAAIVGLAKAMGKDVTCEGVETPFQLEFARELGCKNAQGYLFDKPLTAADCGELLMTNSPYSKLFDSDNSHSRQRKSA